MAAPRRLPRSPPQSPPPRHRRFIRSPSPVLQRAKRRRRQEPVPSHEEIEVLLMVLLCFSNLGRWICGVARPVYEPVYQKFKEMRSTKMTFENMKAVLRHWQDCVRDDRDPVYMKNFPETNAMWSCFKFIATIHLRRKLVSNKEANDRVKRGKCWIGLYDFTWRECIDEVEQIKKEDAARAAEELGRGRDTSDDERDDKSGVEDSSEEETTDSTEASRTATTCADIETACTGDLETDDVTAKDSRSSISLTGKSQKEVDSENEEKQPRNEKDKESNIVETAEEGEKTDEAMDKETKEKKENEQEATKEEENGDEPKEGPLLMENASENEGQVNQQSIVESEETSTTAMVERMAKKVVTATKGAASGIVHYMVENKEKLAMETLLQITK